MCICNFRAKDRDLSTDNVISASLPVIYAPILHIEFSAGHLKVKSCTNFICVPYQSERIW